VIRIHKRCFQFYRILHPYNKGKVCTVGQKCNDLSYSPTGTPGQNVGLCCDKTTGKAKGFVKKGETSTHSRWCSNRANTGRALLSEAGPPYITLFIVRLT